MQLNRISEEKEYSNEEKFDDLKIPELFTPKKL